MIVSNLSVVCCNHSERLERLLPLSGEVRALELLPEIVRSKNSARHPPSRRRGVCGGIAGTARVCRCLSGCLRWLRAFAWCAGLDLWMARFGEGALGEAGCNDQLLTLVLCLGSCLWCECVCLVFWVCGGHMDSPTGDLCRLCSLERPLLGFEGARLCLWPRCYPGAS